jgi:hypothetical protein
MTGGDTRAILELLAAGEITPEEAEAQLGPDGPMGAEDGEPAREASWSAGRRGAVRVWATLNGGGTIEVEGDDVDSPRVEGPARVRTSQSAGGYRVEGMVGDDAVLIVPDDADLRLQLNGASARLAGLRGCIDATMNVGDVELTWEPADGASRLQLNAGNLHVRFGPRADVAVTVHAPTSVHADDSFVKQGRGVWLLGDGRAQLEIDGNLGAILLEAE